MGAIGNNVMEDGRLATTVTFLEMTVPPSRWPARPVNVATALLVADKPPLHYYRYLYFNVGIHWNWEMRLRMDDETLRAAIHDDAVSITVLHVDGAAAGYYELNRKEERTTDIAYFGLMPHAFGRGLGKWFLGETVRAAFATGAERITVNTCTLDHPAALPLYQKVGFRPYRRADGWLTPLSSAERAALAEAHGLTRPVA